MTEELQESPFKSRKKTETKENKKSLKKMRVHKTFYAPISTHNQQIGTLNRTRVSANGILLVADLLLVQKCQILYPSVPQIMNYEL